MTETKRHRRHRHEYKYKHKMIETNIDIRTEIDEQAHR